MDELSLSVEGLRYSGWQSIRVTRSIEQLAPTFAVGFAEQWNELGEPIPINEGDGAIVRLGDDTVITGYVDDSNISYDDATHEANVMGRAITGDLVDCAAIHQGSLWRNADLETIANDLCAPFSLEVDVEGSVGKVFRRFPLQEGETVHETLERAARMRGVLLLTSAEGKLLLTHTGSREVGTALVRGQNIIRGSRRGSMRDRFSQYTGKAQIAGDDSKSGEDVVIKRTVTDERVNRYRPTIIMAETEDTGEELKDRVTWERNRRAGDARRVTYTVQGWRDDDGKLWEPNTLVNVSDGWLRIRGQLLVVSVQYQRSNGGTTTEIELTRKEAFDLIEFPPPKPRNRGEDFYA